LWRLGRRASGTSADILRAMVRHLSAAWIEALDEAAKASAGLRAATAGVAFTVQQVVTAPEGDVVWHLVVDHGDVAVRPGRAEHPDLVFTQDRATAQQVAAGELSAQAAFMVGRLRVGGDLTVLLANQEAIAGLDDVFASVRARTEPAEVGDPTDAVPGRA
jgi:putative sterol carrier protein